MVNVKLIHSVHGCLLRDTIPLIHSFHIPPPKNKKSPPNEETGEMLLVIVMCDDIENIVVTHDNLRYHSFTRYVMDLYPIGY